MPAGRARMVAGERVAENDARRIDGRIEAGVLQRGIRDFEEVDALAAAAGFVLEEDRAMPANNRCIVWKRK